MGFILENGVWVARVEPEALRYEMAARLCVVRERVATNGAQAEALSERVRCDRERLMTLLERYRRR